MNRALRIALDLIFPRTCAVCGKSLASDSDGPMCPHCLQGLPRMTFHNQPFNEIHQKLAAPGILIERATAMFRYAHNSDYATLVRDAKYGNRPWQIRTLARNYAREIAPDGFFADIDAIIPVPMHWWKELKRGFNQSYELARGISDVTRLPILDNLEATRSHTTQTALTGDERRKNLKGIFKLFRPNELDGRHILLVDDIITTGSTMLEACYTINRAATKVRLSVLALASTSYA